jgi:hypothetical protein
MKGKMIRFLVGSLTMFALVIATMTIVNLAVPIVGNDGPDKAYAMGKKHHYQESSGGGSGEKPTHSVPEPSTMILLGSGAGVLGLYKMIKSRKRNRGK